VTYIDLDATIEWFRRPFLHRRAASYYFIYALAFLGFLGVMYIIMNQIVYVNLYQPITLNTNVSAYNFTAQDQQDATDWLAFWNIMPWVIIIVVVIFLIQRTMTARDQ
jgi:ABC-type sugar transport system permease subunit